MNSFFEKQPEQTASARETAASFEKNFFKNSLISESEPKNENDNCSFESLMRSWS